MYGRSRSRDRSRGHARAGGTSLLAAYDFSGGALPSGLLLARASTATVQTGTSTMTTGFANDAARFGRYDDALPQMLVLEMSRINRIVHSRDPAVGLSGGGSYTGRGLNYANGPDGALNTATRYQLVLNNYADTFFGATGTSTSFSWWAKSTGSGSQNTSANSGAQKYTTTAQWGRVAYLAPNSFAFQPADQRWVGAGTVDVLVDAWQCEYDALYSTELILTTGTAQTRAGERLYTSTPTAHVSAGRIGMHASFRPKGSSSQYAANMRLWTIDASNYAQIDSATGAVTVVIGGASYTTASTMSFAARDLVDVWCEAGGNSLNTVVKYRVNGGSTTTLGTSGAPQASIAAPATLDLLCNGTSGQLTAWHAGINFYTANTRPSWAA